MLLTTAVALCHTPTSDKIKKSQPGAPGSGAHVLPHCPQALYGNSRACGAS